MDYNKILKRALRDIAIQGCSATDGADYLTRLTFSLQIGFESSSDSRWNGSALMFACTIRNYVGAGAVYSAHLSHIV